MPDEKLYTPDCIRTYSGQYIDVSKMNTANIFPIDIAMGLARECRFGNHTKKFYSVAEHSIWCYLKAEQLYPTDKALHLRCLLHDAHEAYLGDWCTPMICAIDNLYPGMKRAIDVVKRIVQVTINTRFGISINPIDCDKVHAIDKMALEWEWENKVLKSTGLPAMGDKEIADMWLHYFKPLVTVPFAVAP